MTRTSCAGYARRRLSGGVVIGAQVGYHDLAGFGRRDAAGTGCGRGRHPPLRHMSLRLLTCGEHAVLVELDGLTEVLALDAAVRAAVEAGDAAFANVVDLVPAARTLLLVVREGTDVSTPRAALPTLSISARSISTEPSPASPPLSLEIGVHYDGADLDEVSELTGLTPRDVVAAPDSDLAAQAVPGQALWISLATASA